MFVEASIAVPLEVEDDDSILMTSIIEQQNICDYPIEPPQALKLVCTSLLKDENLFKESLVFIFAKEPYYLEVEKFTIQDNSAYLTFTDEEGMSLSLSIGP